MEKLTLRRATPDDAGAVRKLTREAYAPLVPLIDREPKPMTANYELAVVDHIIDVHEEDGQLLALIELIPKPDHLLIENIAVRPDQHGKGMGGMLLEHAEDIARSLNLNEVRLYTNAKFVSNLGFYSKRGYEEFLRETHPHLGEAVHMRKSIKP